MKRSKAGSTVKQMAYARKLLNADGPNKKEIALSVGFSLNAANSIASKIENTEGFHNAVIKLSIESNEMMTAVFHEYKARGLKDFSNKDLNSAMNAISGAWERFNKHRAPNSNKDPEKNLLKKVILQRIENQTINIPNHDVISKVDESMDLDF